MHIKQKSEDFRVEELTNWQGGKTGDFAFYRLDKRGWTTPDALQIIRKRWKIEVRIHDMTDEQIGAALRALEEVLDVGVPNYYDDQRFGSVAHGGAFLAQQIILGEYEAALQTALTAPYAFERAAQKKEKSMLRQ